MPDIECPVEPCEYNKDGECTADKVWFDVTMPYTPTIVCRAYKRQKAEEAERRNSQEI